MTDNQHENCEDDCGEDGHSHEDQHSHENHLEKDNLNSFTLTGSYEFDEETTQNEIIIQVEEILNWLGTEAISLGAPVIGHIKGWVEMEDKVRFSLVMPEEGVDLGGDFNSDLPVDSYEVKLLAVIPLEDSKLSSLKKKVDAKLRDVG
ncbi:MAG: hypothetical protein EF811_04480 [Methanonatronarchaeia archaeon]|nr:MAG: hypothetical protein EF811_04480 [Methanonatronarchaeia archaeon]